jgi:D-alanyl-lipoteichoic acid acyltransferase DltB (MBOAT superfamily)
MWQDTVIAVCQLAFLPAMWPTIKGKDKPPVSTCVMNVIIVCIIAFSLATLQLWFAFTTAMLIALTWAILAVQKLRMNHKS